MRTFRCTCNNMLFFDNSRCLGCSEEVGFCPACRSVTTLIPQPEGVLKCGNASCGAALLKCSNYVGYDVCNL